MAHIRKHHHHHYHHARMSHHMLAGRRGVASPRTFVPQKDDDYGPEARLFDEFCSANTFQGIMKSFTDLCDIVEVNPSDHRNIFNQLKSRLRHWKAITLWTKLDKRASHRDYQRQQACSKNRVLIKGGGPVGLRMAVEVAFLGAQAVVVEKRDRFSRNNILHLWPFVIHDLRNLGAKLFYGQFCTGQINHISIRALQCILLKCALVLGVELHCNVSYETLIEPVSADTGWRAKLTPESHPVSEYEFDVLIGADGRRQTVEGFSKKDFRGKLAIAITVNFINRRTIQDKLVAEISGVAFIFNQKFFKDLNQKTGIDLENIVYYKGDTHYFVMTAKKASLLLKGVLLYDHSDTQMLLSKENVNQDKLLAYAREAADFSTNYQLPNLEFAHNHYGQPDIAMFDFTSMFASDHASKVIERKGHRLLLALVGDSLLEPFWPTGSGCARGFLGAMDAAWMIKRWASGKMSPLEVLAERESIYKILSQTTPQNLHQTFGRYSIDPFTRYPNLDVHHYKPVQIRSYFDTDDPENLDKIIEIAEQKSQRYEKCRDSHYLLNWMKRQLESYRSTVEVLDLTTTWKSGLALCCLIHKYRPEVIQIRTLNPKEVAKNNQLAFDLAAKEFGISPVMTGEEMAECDVPDRLVMLSYLSQFYDYFRRESIRPAKMARTPETLKTLEKQKAEALKVSPKGRGASSKSYMSKLQARIKQRRHERLRQYGLWSSNESLTISDEEFDNGELGKRPTTFTHGYARKRMKANTAEIHDGIVMKNYSKFESSEPTEVKLSEEAIKRRLKRLPDPGISGKNKVSALAKDLAHKFEGREAPTDDKEPWRFTKPLANMDKDSCYFCKGPMSQFERCSEEGIVFHQACLVCDYCSTNPPRRQFAFQRDENGDVKCYCVQHIGKKQGLQHSRKRSFEDLNQIPLPLDLLDSSASPDNSLNRTRERVEYHTESEMEESEIAQTTHNLSSSFLFFDDSDLSDSEKELMALCGSSSDEDVFAVGDDDPELSDGNVSWAEIARTYRRHLRPKRKKRVKEPTKNGEGDDSDSSRESDSWSTESETEKESEGESEDEDYAARKAKARAAVKALILPEKVREPEEKKPSPGTDAIHRNRMAFFSAPTEPVRINAKNFLGLQTPKDVTPEREDAKPIPDEEEPAVEGGEPAAEGGEPAEAKEESESGSSDYDNLEKDEETITEGSDSEDENSGYVQSIQAIPTIEIVDVGGPAHDSDTSEPQDEGGTADETAETTETESQVTGADSQLSEAESVKMAAKHDAMQRIDALLNQVPKDEHSSGGDTEEDVEDVDLQDELEKIDEKMKSMRQDVNSMMPEDLNRVRIEEVDEEDAECYIPESSTLTENMAGILTQETDTQQPPRPVDPVSRPNEMGIGFQPIADFMPPVTSEPADIISPSVPLIDFGDSPPEKMPEADAKSPLKKPEAVRAVTDMSSQPLEDLEEKLLDLSSVTNQPLINLLQSPTKPVAVPADTLESPVKLHDGLQDLISTSDTASFKKPQPRPAIPSEDISVVNDTISDIRTSDVTADILGDETSDNLDSILDDNAAVSTSVLDDTITQEVKAQRGAFRVPPPRPPPPKFGFSSPKQKEEPKESPINVLSPIVQSPPSHKSPSSAKSSSSAQSPVSFRSPSDPVSFKSPSDPVSFKPPSEPVSFKPPSEPVSFKSPSEPISFKSPSETELPPSLASDKISSYTKSVLSPESVKTVTDKSSTSKPKLKVDIKQKHPEKEESVTPEVEKELIVKASIKSDIKAKALKLLQNPGPLHNPVFDSQPGVKRPQKPLVVKSQSLHEQDDSKYRRKYQRMPNLPPSVVVTSPPTFISSPPKLVQAPISQTISAATQAKSRMLFTEKPKPTTFVPSAGSAFSRVPVKSHEPPPPQVESDPDTGKEEDAMKRIDNLLESLADSRDPQSQEDQRLSPDQDSSRSEAHKVRVSAEFEGDKEFVVDETFITTRGRRKVKTHVPSRYSDSNITPSSGSSVKSVSSADGDSMGRSLGDTLNEVDSIDLLLSDRETSVSLEGLLESNIYEDNAVARKAKSETKLTESIHDPTVVENDSVHDSSNSQYFTPNASGVEPMDLSLDIARDSSRSSNYSESKSLHSDKSSPILSPRRNMGDAKRQFFFDESQPVRIDPKKFFPELKTPDGKVKKIVESPKKMPSSGKENVQPVENGTDNSKKADLEKVREWKSVDRGISTPEKGKLGDVEMKRDWQSFDNELLSSPTNIASPSDEVFSTPASTMKSKPEADDDDVFKKPVAPSARKRILPDLPAEKTKVDLNNKVLTYDEIKMIREVEQEKLRQQARERARLLSDEELGIPAVRKGSLKNTPSGDELDAECSVSESHSAMSEPDKSDSSKLDSQLSEPSAKSDDFTRTKTAEYYHRQVSSDPECTYGSTESASASDRSQEKIKTGPLKSDPKPKRFKLKTPEKTKSIDRVKARDDIRREKKVEEKDKTEKKEKRRSLLALFMPSKSVEKKDKDKETKSPKIKDDKAGGDKKLGVKLRVKLKPQKSAEKEAEEKEKRTSSALDEFVPFFEDISGEDLDPNRSSFRNRLEQVAPNQPKTTPKIAPKAQVEDFDTESEMGDDRISIHSFQSIGGMNDEELARYRKKQEKIAVRKQREEEMKRVRMAYEIQRHLDELEIKQKEVESRGISIERALRGEGPEASSNESRLMQEWFNVVHEKNALVRYESELLVHARELELQDRHSRLESELRDLMNIEERNKSIEQKEEEQRILEELLEVVEQRNALVALLEEDRLKEREADHDLTRVMASKGLQLSPIALK